MRVLPAGPSLSSPRPVKRTLILLELRLLPAALVSSSRTSVMPPDLVHSWKARVRPSAVHDNGAPEGLLLPTQVSPADFGVHVPRVCGQIQSRSDPTASVITLISAGRTISASLLPS